MTHCIEVRLRIARKTVRLRTSLYQTARAKVQFKTGFKSPAASATSSQRQIPTPRLSLCSSTPGFIFVGARGPCLRRMGVAGQRDAPLQRFEVRTAFYLARMRPLEQDKRQELGGLEPGPVSSPAALRHEAAAAWPGVAEAWHTARQAQRTFRQLWR